MTLTIAADPPKFTPEKARPLPLIPGESPARREAREAQSRASSERMAEAMKTGEAAAQGLFGLGGIAGCAFGLGAFGGAYALLRRRKIWHCDRCSSFINQY